jgi:hypothetical protein
VAKTCFSLCGLTLVVVLLNPQTWGQISTGPRPDLATSFVGSNLTCSQPQNVFLVPKEMAEQAKLKARLVTLLRESLSDDVKGIVNIEREKEIRKLASKLGRHKGD